MLLEMRIFYGGYPMHVVYILIALISSSFLHVVNTANAIKLFPGKLWEINAQINDQLLDAGVDIYAGWTEEEKQQRKEGLDDSRRSEHLLPPVSKISRIAPPSSCGSGVLNCKVSFDGKTNRVSFGGGSWVLPLDQEFKRNDHQICINLGKPMSFPRRGNLEIDLQLSFDNPNDKFLQYVHKIETNKHIAVHGILPSNEKVFSYELDLGDSRYITTTSHEGKLRSASEVEWSFNDNRIIHSSKVISFATKVWDKLTDLQLQACVRQLPNREKSEISPPNLKIKLISVLYQYDSDSAQANNSQPFAPLFNQNLIHCLETSQKSFGCTLAKRRIIDVGKTPMFLNVRYTHSCTGSPIEVGFRDSLNIITGLPAGTEGVLSFIATGEVFLEDFQSFSSETAWLAPQCQIVIHSIDTQLTPSSINHLDDLIEHLHILKQLNNSLKESLVLFANLSEIMFTQDQQSIIYILSSLENQLLTIETTIASKSPDEASLSTAINLGHLRKRLNSYTQIIKSNKEAKTTAIKIPELSDVITTSIASAIEVITDRSSGIYNEAQHLMSVDELVYNRYKPRFDEVRE